MAKILYMGSDHAGLSLKNALLPALRQQGWTIEDMGTQSGDSCDYPDFAHAVCTKVLENDAFGILICGTGIGMSMAANRHKGIRAALCTHEFHARATREHNNANVLCLGERVTAPGLAVELATIFLSTEYAGGRHQKRIEKIDI
ncbi:putative sugar phosphate isomerase YwlF [uncultured delta proteobacterium]|uniref:Putative sugar phosphate isomerase YwlF n=1 Tax=uncultured delta proteobacterium TaxID=34034 RepID=A0A212J655_9DELT|nr:putative sugar phosphate isomerase YwlF [uncultured delta proteobacterium]